MAAATAVTSGFDMVVSDVEIEMSPDRQSQATRQQSRIVRPILSFRHWAGAILAAAGLAGLSPVAHAAPYSSVGGFCTAHPDDDNPNNAFYGADFRPGNVPHEVASSGANTWRCMDARAWVCNVGADGYLCQKLDPHPTPSKPIREYCGAHPGADFVPMVVVGNSFSTWRCLAKDARPIEMQHLDKRGFVKKAWRLLPQ
jgi:hypothetical protein